MPGDSLREALILGCAAVLLLDVHYVERLPFTSIGIGTSEWWKSTLWGVVTAAICLAAASSIMYVTKFDGGPHDFEKLLLWLVTVIVFRARLRRRALLSWLCHRTPWQIVHSIEIGKADCDEQLSQHVI